MQERVMFGPIFEPAIPPWCWSAGGGACDRVELPALLPRTLRGHAPQEAVRGSLIKGCLSVAHRRARHRAGPVASGRMSGSTRTSSTVGRFEAIADVRGALGGCR